MSPDERAAARRDLVCWLALLGAALLALYLCWLMLQPLLDVLLWSAVLVIVFRPLHRFLRARTGRPVLSALLSCALVAVVLLLPLTLILLAVINELSDLPSRFEADLTPLLDPASPQMRPILAWLDHIIDVNALRSPSFQAERVRDLAAPLSQWALGLVSNVAEAAFKVFFVLIAMYYLFRDGDRIMAQLRCRLPLAAEQTEAILRRTREVIDASVYGVLVIAILQGTLGGVAFGVLGLPSPVLWALAMTVFSTIPLAGSFLVWVPAALWLLLTGFWVKALILALWCGLVVGGLDNLLRPRLVGQRAGLHELFIFFSVLGGLRVFGILGMVLGPVILAVTLALLEIIFENPGEEVQNERREKTTPCPPAEPGNEDRGLPHGR